MVIAYSIGLVIALSIALVIAYNIPLVITYRIALVIAYSIKAYANQIPMVANVVGLTAAYSTVEINSTLSINLD